MNNQLYIVVANRFAKTFASTFASSIVLLPALTPATWSDVTTYLHALALAAVSALIMALEKTLSYTPETPSSALSDLPTSVRYSNNPPLTDPPTPTNTTPTTVK